jgi:signal transduction histidine kinase
MKFSDFKNHIHSSNYTEERPQVTSQRFKDLESILSVVKNINSTIILEDVLAVVLTHAIEISHAERGFIVLVDEMGRLEFKLGLDYKGYRLPENYFKISQSVVDDVFSTGQAKFIEGAQNNFEGQPTKSILELSLQTILCAPLITENKKIGVIYVDSKKITKVKNREITFTFEILAEHASTAIRNAQLFKNIKNAKHNAEISQDLKIDFMAQMSHEVRTPLNTIINFSHLLKEEIRENVPPEVKSSLDLIESSGMKIIKSFDLLLNMAELKTGTYDFSPKAMDIYKNILLPVFNEYKNLANDKKLEIKILNETENCEIYGDEYTILLLMNNIVSNALKFTIFGSIILKISDNKETNKIAVEVTDTGIGISKEYLSYLFESDLKLKEKEQGYGIGSGLGLTLARKYAEMNDVNLNIVSQKGKGTTVTLQFNKS